MPCTAIHRFLTGEALRLVPQAEGSHEKLIQEYCNYPDLYFSDDSVKYVPYMFFLDGIQFHYLPDISYNELYRYWTMEDGCHRSRGFVNENFRHAKAGFHYYLTRTSELLRRQESEEGRKYLGCLLHVLEDALFGVHALEGAGGFDIFAPARMFDSSVNLTEMLMNLSCLDCRISDYTPNLLGNNPEEITMNLYAEYCRRSAVSRKCCFQLIRNVLDQRQEDSPWYIRKMADQAVQICADVIFSLSELLHGTAKMPGPVRLDTLAPMEFPLGGYGAYRGRAVEIDRAFDSEGAPLPLAFMVDGQRRECQYGVSFGTHLQGALTYWIAPETFSACSCRIGLHPDCPGDGEFVLQVWNQDKLMEECVLTPGADSREIYIPHPGNNLSFRFRSTPGCGVVVLSGELRHL